MRFFEYKPSDSFPWSLKAFFVQYEAQADAVLPLEQPKRLLCVQNSISLRFVTL